MAKNNPAGAAKKRPAGPPPVPQKRTPARAFLSVAAAAALDYALSWMLFRYFHAPAKFFLIVPVMLGVGYLMKRAAAGRRERQAAAWCVVFACLLALALVLGGKIDTAHRAFKPLFRSDLGYFAGFAVLFFFAGLWAADVVRKHPMALRAGKRRFGAVWAVCSGILFLCWIPCLLLYYPGNISPDSVACLIRAAGEAPLFNQQPVLYILSMRPFLLLAGAAGKSRSFGAALFLLFQAAAMAAMLGYLPAWLMRKGCRTWVVLPVMAYFILNPVFPMYSVTMWKDVPFAGVMLLYLLQLFDIVESGGQKLRSPRALARFLALNVLLCFLRNNGYYVVLVTLAVLAVVYRKFWKRLVPAFLAVAVAVPVVQGPVYRLCGVRPSPFAESVGIPLQQIGYTVAHGGALTAAQAAFLNRLLPLDEMKRAYNPFTSNDIKFHKDFDGRFLEEHKSEFLKVWAEMLPANFKGYAKAHMMETVGFWNTETFNWVLYYGTPESFLPYARSKGIVPADLFFGKTKLQSLRGALERNFTVLQNQIPLLAALVNIGTLFWATAFAAVLLFIRRKGRYFLVLMPLLLLWGTLMLATPTFCEFRYMFSFAAALPLTVLLPFLQKAPAQPRGAEGKKRAAGENKNQ
ncbi:MAG TPA: hypothetical protein DDW99_06250 [Ruminococcaceae bacterium]|jgi:hypothetical protein|nr:hypothetical protein [Oscillospiraceae bacterium]HBQ46593.1 hypothetical protein [Oscillospiraceae bacterium]